LIVISNLLIKGKLFHAECRKLAAGVLVLRMNDFVFLCVLRPFASVDGF
jgi:hypothetical protein